MDEKPPDVGPCPEPDDIRGKTPEEIDGMMKEKGWPDEPTKRGGGTEYKNPNKLGERVRIHQGALTSQSRSRGLLMQGYRVTGPNHRPYLSAATPTYRHMKADETRANILELCSESEYGFWEFWTTKHENRTTAQAEHIVQTLLELIREGKIYAVEYASVRDRSYREVQVNGARLRDQMMASMKSGSIVDTDDAYWFLATEEGEKEDQLLRTPKR